MTLSTKQVFGVFCFQEQKTVLENTKQTGPLFLRYRDCGILIIFIFYNFAYFASFSKYNNFFSYAPLCHNERYNFIFELRPFLRLAMSSLCPILVSFFTSYDEGLCISMFEAFLLVFSSYRLLFTSSMDNAPFKIKLLIVTTNVSQLFGSQHNKESCISSSITIFIATNRFIKL